MSKLPCPPELWSAFSALLDVALDMPEAEREAWLASLGPEHAAVKPWLSRTLAEAARLETRDLRQPPQSVAAESEFSVGERFGPYVLERRLGHGGMGEVWVAVRVDGVLNRSVALKLPYAHLVAGAARRRFERERDILGGLAHPNIAQLYDAGLSEKGHPFLAMELVDGKDLTRYCEDAQCDIAQRLQLFEQILDTVHYAHMRFIAHRDLKPSNILVTERGQIKLLDFGIAKLLAPEESGEPTELTRLGGRLLTPHYAAPEQSAGGAVTTASDIYSLGVVLFLLLTGQHPFAGAAATHARDAPLASSRVPDIPPACGLSARSLRRALCGDLDAILAKALHANPSERYQSALAFAADLQRYRAHEPVTALRVGGWVLAGKFLYRHRLGAAVAAVLLLTVAAGVAGVLWQARVAEREARRATAVKNFLVGVFKASDPRVPADKPRDQVTARDLLDNGAQRAREGSFGEVDTQIELLGILGEIYYELGDPDQFQSLHRRQLELAEAHYGKDNPVSIDGLLLEAEIAALEANYPQAQSLLERADQAMRRSGSNDPVQRAQWWFYRALALRADPKAGAARRDALLKAVELYRRYAPRDDNYSGALSELGFYYYSDEGRHEEAARYFRAAIAARDQSDDPDEADQAEAYANLANMLSMSGELDEAERAFQQALDLLRRTYGEHHPSYFVPAANYAKLVHWRGDRERAWRMFGQLETAIPPEAASSYDALVVGEIQAACLVAEGRALEAVPLLEAAEHSYVDKPVHNADLHRVRLSLGEAYEAVGRREDARRELQAALDDFIAERPPGNYQVLWVREVWGRLLMDQNDLTGAQAQFQEVARWSDVHDLGQGYVALANGGLARLALLRHDSTAALASIAAAERGLDTLRAAHDVRWGPYLWLIHAQALSESGDLRSAAQWAQRALEADQRYDAPSSPDIAQASAVLASITARTPTYRH
jgi:serine/threonine-protein kinase